MKRVLCLYLPFLSTERWQRRDSAFDSSGDRAIATIAPKGRVLRIVHVNAPALALHIRPGQTLADAKAIAPDLIACDDDPIADQRQLESLAIWADRFSPIVQITSEDTLMADVTGTERLFGSEHHLLTRAIDELGAMGFSVRGVVADTPGAAWAIAHAHSESAVIAPPGQNAAYMALLPVSSLRVDGKTVDALATVGVKTIASLLYLPRSSLALRFGETVLRRLDQALGDLPEVLTPYEPPKVFTSRIHFGTSTTQLDLLREAIHRALESFCTKLKQQVAGVRQLFVTFYCVRSFDATSATGGGRYNNATAFTGGGRYKNEHEGSAHAESSKRTITLEANLSTPTRSAPHLRSLLMVLLDRLQLPAPAYSLMLWARDVEPLDGWQDELFATDSADDRRLAGLLDRLMVRLGSEAVVRPALLSEHQPERAFRYVPVTNCGKTSMKQATTGATRTASLMVGRTPDTMTTPSTSEPPRGLKPAAQVDGPSASKATVRSWGEDVAIAGPRPLRLSPNPVEIEVTSMVPEGPPIAFRLQGIRHTIAASIGPERIETGWWRGPHIQRDYYRTRTKAGQQCWIFRDRDTGAWFLHGWFD